MFDHSRDLAEAALRLLDRTHSENDPNRSDLEIAAAILAVHVHDWIVIRELGHDDVGNEHRDAFKARFPSWDALRLIANGTKHPIQKYPDISTGTLRHPEWEDLDYWNAPQTHPTLFVLDKNEEERSVHSLTFEFCSEYLGTLPKQFAKIESGAFRADVEPER
jgi:hypothetical protein